MVEGTGMNLALEMLSTAFYAVKLLDIPGNSSSFIYVFP